MKKKVTIQDIADALKISRNTVSKAINNSEGLAEETRERILQKAVEMGYKQFSYVQTLAKAQFAAEQTADRQPFFAGEIALFSTIFLNASHFSSLMLDRFQRELAQMGYTLNTHRVDPENLANHTLPLTFIRDRVKGIICFEMFNRSYDEMLCELGIPILFVDGPCKRDGLTLPADQLYMDNTTGIAKIVTDFLRSGINRIGFIGNYEHCESFFERYLAFRSVMLSNKIPVNESWIIKENNAENMSLLLKKLEDLPDVFLCANDFVAFEAIKILREMGKSVPEDVMISGFDDSAESRLIIPPLTTVHIHTQIMAFSAVHLLISRIEEPSLDFRAVYTETYPIYRESTPAICSRSSTD